MAFTSKTFESELRATFNNIHNNDIRVDDIESEVKNIDIYDIYKDMDFYDENYNLSSVLKKRFHARMQKDIHETHIRSFIYLALSLVSSAILLGITLYMKWDTLYIILSGVYFALSVILTFVSLWLRCSWTEHMVIKGWIDQIKLMNHFSRLMNSYVMLKLLYEGHDLNYRNVLIEISSDLNSRRIPELQGIIGEIIGTIKSLEKYFNESEIKNSVTTKTEE